VSIETRLRRLEKLAQKMTNAPPRDRCERCRDRLPTVLRRFRQDGPDTEPVACDDGADDGRPCGCGWTPAVVELVAAVVHTRDEVTGVRAAARAAGVEVLGDRTGVADLADEEGPGAGRVWRMVPKP
jgi:hypothetical protein